MKKIIFLFIFFAFLALPIFASASTYVVVTIGQTEKPSSAGGGTFCLPAGTQMSIWSGTTQKGITITATDQLCAGDTITSSTVSLTAGQTYTARLEVPLCFGGKLDANGNCWYKGSTTGKSCNQICSEHGTTKLEGSYCCEQVDTSCEILSYFFNCADGCYQSSAYPYYYDYSGNYNYCYEGDTYGYSCTYDSCDMPGYDDGAKRICSCESTGTFNFSFQAAGS